jgi:hypothetical protein
MSCLPAYGRERDPLSKVYDAITRAQRKRDAAYGDGGSLRDRLPKPIPKPRSAGAAEIRPLPAEAWEELDLQSTASPGGASTALVEEFASLQVAVDALDDRLSAEVVEREAKLLAEIRVGMRGLEISLQRRMAALEHGMQRSVQRSTALVVGSVALLAALLAGTLLMP